MGGVDPECPTGEFRVAVVSKQGFDEIAALRVLTGDECLRHSVYSFVKNPKAGIRWQNVQTGPLPGTQ